MSVETAHKDCDTCNWLALDAGQSATDSGSDTWLATDADHYARYEKEIDMTTIDTTALRTELTARLGKPARPEPQDADRFLAVLDRLAEAEADRDRFKDSRDSVMGVLASMVRDAASAVGHPELAEDGDWGSILEFIGDAREAAGQTATAEAAVQRVREMHEPIPVSEYTIACSCGWWSHDGCPTVRALDGDA